MVYIGGTHPAAAGGAYMTAIKGFAGITIENDRINAHPSLPDGWKKMKFSMFYRGELYEERDSLYKTKVSPGYLLHFAV